MIPLLWAALGCAAEPADPIASTTLAPLPGGTGTVEDPTLNPTAELLGVVVYRNGRGFEGYVDPSGNWVLAPDFASLPDRPTSSLIFAKGIDEAILVDRTGPRIATRKLGKRDLIDTDRGVAIECSPEGWSLVDATGNRRAGPFSGTSCASVQFDDANLAGACTQEGCGYVGVDGVFAVPPIWDATTNFSGGLGWVRSKSGKQGFVDPNGAVAVPAEWDIALDFEDGFAWVGRTIVGTPWGEEPQHDWFVVDRKGLVVAVAPHNLTPDNVGDPRFHNGLAAAHSPAGSGLVTPSLQWVFGPTKARNPGPFQEQRAAVWKEGKLGFVDAAGKLVIPHAFDATLDDGSQVAFAEGLAAVQEPGGSTWGYIDAAGVWVIGPAYNHAGPFERGWASVTRTGVAGRIWVDKAGHELVPR